MTTYCQFYKDCTKGYECDSALTSEKVRELQGQCIFVESLEPLCFERRDEEEAT